MIASILGQIGHPFYIAFASLLASFYALIPSYAIVISLLKVAVMIVVLPITLRSTRGMMKMQLLAPDIKRLQAKYKVQPGMSPADRQQLRHRQQEEVMAVYRENNVSPTGGCLPLLMQFPIFIILYGTIRGLIHQAVVKGTSGPDPLYISHSTRIYKSIATAHGQLTSFGLNLAYSVRAPGLAWVARLPFIAMIVVAVALQYAQMRQLAGRNSAMGAPNPQMQRMQRMFPLVFAVIYISLPAGVNLYFIVSSLFRMVQQEVMYRLDPHIRASLERLRAQTKPG
jgi:YidC/Oxa1 family membrane protein insertase